MRALSSSPSLLARIRLSPMRLTEPAVNGPLEKFHLTAIAACADVRVSEICRTSVSAVTNCGEPTTGGAGARNWLGDVRKKGRVPYSERTIAAVDDTHLSDPVGTAPGAVT